MAVNPFDVYSIVAHPELSAEDKRAKIDALYGVPAIAMPAAGPDVRTADVDARSILAGSGALDAPPAPAPMMSDAGGMSVAPPAPAPAPAVSVPPPPAPAPTGGMSAAPDADGGASSDANMSAPSGASVRAEAPVVHAAVSHESGDTAPESPSDEDLLTAGVNALVTGAMRGTPARRVAAHDQPTASVIERAGGVPDDVKQRLADDAKQEASLALEEGDAQAKQHLDAAIGADIQARDSRAELATLKDHNARAEAHVQQLDRDFEQMVKDTAIKPSDWWTSKSTGGKITSLLGAIMFGLAGDPNGLQRVIDEDLALKQKQRDARLGAFKSRIDDFRSRLMSPEAANAAERALAAQAVAAEANRFAEAAAAPEARLRAQAVAQHFQSEFDRLALQMAQSESGTIRTNIAHVPERVVGGAPDPMTVLKKAKELGLSPEETIKVLMGGTYGVGGKDDAKTRVILPGGEVGYTSEDLHKETQTQMDALQGLQANLARIKALSASTGHTLAGPEKARLQSVIADTTMQLQAMARGEGAQARMAGEMLEKLEPLTGSKALETGTLDSTARAGIDEASRLYESHIQGIRARLTPTAKTAPAGGKIKTLGSSGSKEAVGFEHE